MSHSSGPGAPTRVADVLAPYFDITQPGNAAVMTKHPAKIVRRIFWRRTDAREGPAHSTAASPSESALGAGLPPFAAGVYIFGRLCQGPPNRAYLGAAKQGGGRGRLGVLASRKELFSRVRTSSYE